MRAGWPVAVAAVGITLVLCAPRSEAQCVQSHRTAGQAVGYNSVQLVANVPASMTTAVRDGYGEWNKETCNPGQKAFPVFHEGSRTGARVISINFYQGANPDNRSSCGRFALNEIKLYEVALVGSTMVPCTPPEQVKDTISHELGHLLGLDDRSTSCPNHIMSPRQVSAGGTYTDRKVQTDECAKVAETNATPEERANAGCATPLTAPGRGVRRIAAPLLDPCDDGTGGSGPGGTGDTRDPGSPIIIDLDRGGFELTSAANGVLFDIDADGVPEQMAWTAPDTGDAFLALDRNENGWIDDGRELFGDHAPQPPSNEPHGFLALSVYDDDADGWITDADPIFSYLRLWTDSDHDGFSLPFELVGLEAAGVRAISLHPVESRRRDQHGNEFRYMALVRMHRAVTQAVDVFFRLE